MEALWLQAALQVPVLVLALYGLWTLGPAFQGLRNEMREANTMLLGLLRDALGRSDPHGYLPPDPGPPPQEEDPDPTPVVPMVERPDRTKPIPRKKPIGTRIR